MNILGIHDGHNASVCLLQDGRITFAIQEERICGEKNFFGFPYLALQRAMKFEDLTPDKIDYIAMAGEYVPKPVNQEALVNIYRNQAELKGKIQYIVTKTPFYKFYKKRRTKERLFNLRKAGFTNDVCIRFYNHHLCHAASAYYGVPGIKDKESLILTLDGSGDGLCSSVNIGVNGTIYKIAETKKGHSLGNIYSQVTFMLGFIPWEHEYKLMGMAPYASKKGRKIATDVFMSYLGFSSSNPLVFKRKIPEPTMLIYSRLKKDLEFLRTDWICAGLQCMTEEIIIKWVKNCIQKTNIHTIILSGGVFMNVKANKKIMELPEVEQLYIMPSCGDETNSFGAAYLAWIEFGNPSYSVHPFMNLYLGDSFTDEEIKLVLEKSENLYSYKYYDDIETKVAKLLSDGEIVARCKGRMEFGARALGNRSILADPSRLECINIINNMIKNRDFWMPFAPVILKDQQDAYIINPKGFDAPYMIISFDSTDKNKEMLAAIHPADKTARPQVISEEQNLDYYRILKQFNKLTGRGVLLNTSFNLHGFPIVYGPKEAIHVFNNSGLKFMALGNYLVHKHDKN